jgi:hypothetical protein
MEKWTRVREACPRSGLATTPLSSVVVDLRFRIGDNAAAKALSSGRLLPRELACRAVRTIAKLPRRWRLECRCVTNALVLHPAGALTWNRASRSGRERESIVSPAFRMVGTMIGVSVTSVRSTADRALGTAQDATSQTPTKPRP